MRARSFRRQRGAALLAAMLIVTLVATFAAAALWQQWRAAEVEAAERGRMQSAWVLIGAIDWSRLILREDGRAGGPDHLAEPWAIPLEEARLSSFVAAEKNVASDALEGLPDAFLSGRIVDAQSKLNVTNLMSGGKPVKTAVAAFTKLFELLGLPGQEVAIMTANLQRALPVQAVTSPAAAASAGAGGLNTPVEAASTAAAADATGPLLPQQTTQLAWLGLSSATISAIEPYVTILPVGTPLNLNTASAEAIYASVPALDLAGAKRIVAQRTRGHFKGITDASALVPDASSGFNDLQHSINTRFFEVHGRLRLDRTWVEEHSLLRRDGLDVRIVWRNRGAGATPLPPKS
ncbi:type II secretion system minor pseudopilin GspK [Variovorax sp. PAMC 28711]|uniref:type II secretion system minor pseudopilin GspK n=1 Tax=Variovorax sp. PAMC 28711 TaxID=1795631 RepID=UPI00078EB3A7|nr:type II secretion system minor pseudopilin GspK [Variovorax sp. PAMC 28711]AMM23939.1 general secretion pathway protein GspK [Variovorax sp. PAMC 28711]